MIETLSEAFIAKALQLAAKKRQPAQGTFELTSRCNLFCPMCYIREPAGNKTIASKELSASSWLKLAREAVDHGMVFLLLTGGEVFLRRDFFEIYGPLTHMGLVISLYTNGTLISKEIAKRLAEAPPSSTDVTLYGATATTFETVTGVKGSFAACCAGIEALLSHKIPLHLKTTITRHNVHELKAMYQMAQSWGVSFSAGWILSKRHDGSRSDVEDCRLSAVESVDLEALDRAFAHDVSEPVYKRNINRNDNFLCHSGKSAFLVNSMGEMNACQLIPQPKARPLERGFLEAWKEVQQYVDSSPSIAASECGTCDVFEYCKRCPAWSMSETHTLNKPVPYLCEIAKIRKERYEKPAP